jgi:hypothetical protein
MNNGDRNAEDGPEDEIGDVYVRYVGNLLHCRAVRGVASSLTFRRRRRRRRRRIRLPHSEMALSFKGNYAGAPVSIST